MPGKLARSGPRPSFGLAAVPVTVGTSRLSCGNAVKREYSRRFGSHLGNPGLNINVRTRIQKIQLAPLVKFESDFDMKLNVFSSNV